MQKELDNTGARLQKSPAENPFVKGLHNPRLIKLPQIAQVGQGQVTVKPYAKDMELDTRVRVAKGNDGALKESKLPAHDAHAVTKRDGRSDDTSGHTHGRVLGNRQRGQVVDSGHALIFS